MAMASTSLRRAGSDGDFTPTADFLAAPSSEFLELAIAPLLKTCHKVDTPPPKFTVRNLSSVPSNVKLRDDVSPRRHADLAINMRTKSSGTLRVLPNQINGKFYTDSEKASEGDFGDASTSHSVDRDNGIFRFDLKSTCKSSTINSKMPLVKSLKNLRKFKLGISPRRKMKVLDDHLDKTGNTRVFQDAYDYDRFSPNSRSLGPSTPSTMPTSQPPTHPKNVVVKEGNRKAIALSAEAQGGPPPLERSSSQRQLDPPIALNAKDTRSYDDDEFGPLYSPQKKMAQSVGTAPLLDLALSQVSDSDSVTIDSYREEQREHFLQHNISRSDDEGFLSKAPTAGTARTSFSDSSHGSFTRAELPGGSLLRRPRRYANDAEDFTQRPHTVPLSPTAAQQQAPRQAREIPTVPSVSLAQRQSFHMDPNPQQLRQGNKVKMTFSDPFKAPLRCVKCFKVAELWCTQCTQAYCILCWNRIPHHALFDSETIPDARVCSSSGARASGSGTRRSILKTNEESGPALRKSYASKVLFTEYRASSPASSGNDMPALMPHEVDFFADPLRGKHVFMEKDGSVRMSASADLSSSLHLSTSHASPPRSRTGARPRSQGHGHGPGVGQGPEGEFQQTVISTVRYQAEQDHFRPHSTGKIVVRARGGRPKSPAFSAGADSTVNISHSKRFNPSAHSIVGISHDFQPVDWKEGLFVAKDPLGIANKHAQIDPDQPSDKATAVLDGVPVRVLKSR